MLNIKGNEQRIDETIKQVRMIKTGFVHLNFLNAARCYDTGSFIKCRTPIDVAYTVSILNEFWGENTTMHFIELFEPAQLEHWCMDETLDAGINYDYCEACEEERNYDCNGISDKAIERFSDFCAAFKMTHMVGFQNNGVMLCIEFVNRNRDILIDDEVSEVYYLGRFTTIKNEGRWFSAEQLNNLVCDEEE
jgi:hypothetical protein